MSAGVLSAGSHVSVSKSACSKAAFSRHPFLRRHPLSRCHSPGSIQRNLSRQHSRHAASRSVRILGRKPCVLRHMLGVGTNRRARRSPGSGPAVAQEDSLWRVDSLQSVDALQRSRLVRFDSPGPARQLQLRRFNSEGSVWRFQSGRKVGQVGTR